MSPHVASELNQILATLRSLYESTDKTINYERFHRDLHGILNENPDHLLVSEAAIIGEVLGCLRFGSVDGAIHELELLLSGEEQKQAQAQEHTPGPWVIEENAVVRIIDADDCYVADVFPALMGNPTRNHTLANALLIAAAPDMKGALKNLDAMWTHDFPLGPDTPENKGVRLTDHCAAVWRQVRSAIAKAEGRT